MESIGEITSNGTLVKINFMKQTILNPYHKKLGAKLVDFSGWEMPIYYKSILEEHKAVRESVGAFDVSHMGEIFVSGEDASAFLEKLTCNSLYSLANGQIQYNAILNKSGGIVDDVTIYQFSKNEYMICSNASNYEKVFAHLQNIPPSEKVSIKNESDKWSQIAIQGPDSENLMEVFFKQSFSDLKYFYFTEISFENHHLIISRTGYTGEDGFEIYGSNSSIEKIWKSLLEDRKSEFPNLKVCGLGARDILRIEAKYSLYGHELKEEWTPVESGLSWIVKEKKEPYLGYEKIQLQKKNGVNSKIYSFKLIEPGVSREGYKIYNLNEKEIGFVTSGTFSPVQNASIGFCFLEESEVLKSKEFFIEIRGIKKKACIYTMAFIKGSIKK